MIKTFLFKYVNNTLGVGARVQHINPNYDAGCTVHTFCSILNLRPVRVPLETVLHVFWDCPRTNIVLNEVSIFFLGFVMNKEEWFGIKFLLNREELYILGIFKGIIKYVIWSCRLRKKLIYSAMVIREVNHHLEYIFMANSKYKKNILQISNSLVNKRHG